jgi:hypothetical protein
VHEQHAHHQQHRPVPDERHHLRLEIRLGRH